MMSARRRVLVIDDDASARQTTHAMLLPENLDIELLSSGAEALARLDSDQPDVVICDVMMPGIDGYTVCRAIKDHEVWRYVPVVLLTALSEEGDHVYGFEAGADHFVTKPTVGSVLRSRVRSM